jgi:hypothetical protein
MRTMMAVLCCSILILGCVDTGVEPGPSTLPPLTSLPEAQRLILGRWTLVELWVNGSKHIPSAGYREMVFAADGIARTYWDGQLISVEHFSIHQTPIGYYLMLDTTPKDCFCIAGNYFSWNNMPWDGDACLYKRTSSWEH